MVCTLLDFAAEGKVSGVSDSGDDVALAGEFLIYCGNPKSDFRAEHLTKVIYGIAAGNGAHKVDAGGGAAFFLDLFNAHFHGGTGGKEGIGKDKGFPLQRRGGAVLGLDLEIAEFPGAAVGRKERCLCVVEQPEHTLLDGKAGTEDGAYDKLGIRR